MLGCRVSFTSSLSFISLASFALERRTTPTTLTWTPSTTPSDTGSGARGLFRRGAGAGATVLHRLRCSHCSCSLLTVIATVNGNAPPEPRPQPSPQISEDSITARRQKKSFNPLTRQKSNGRDSQSKTVKVETKRPYEQPPKTAPLQSDWPQQEDMRFLKPKTEKRGKSAERAPQNEAEEQAEHVKLRQKDKEREREKEREKEKEKDKGGFMSGSRNAVSKAAKGGGNLLTRLGKIGRSSSNNEKEVPDSEYVCRMIILPLVEQTRKTRISKDLASCRDKTEFWMPSLPWRCIDYLNLNCESEGLYRVPGSGPQVKHWQRRFDTELDVDLLDEQELYDPNNIGSMLKSWLRDLPTEIMPASLQASLAIELEQENPDYTRMGQPAPQKLRDALSELPPFNYYLLFAITCHLSLLLSHKEKNKMDLNNLSICIGPCLRLERWLFNYLVGDWRHCWQGCFTEKQYLDAEKAYERGEEYEVPVLPTQGSANLAVQNGVQDLAIDERAVHSSGTESSGPSKPGSQYEDARPTLSEDSGSGSRRENVTPETYRPSGVVGVDERELSNGGLTALPRSPSNMAAAGDAKRPATAGETTGKSDETPKVGTPRLYSHSRSKSDVATTPVKTSVDYAFPMPGGRS
ncbi:hypothetical protein BAUCODRAFT_329514 [Baudoinia panamericana UAMH 10762]|uniref:Rho-GAP domain-containing protein n=1 Tax=Baudoinia panamericana (strain UAMH 10762) TaxID=717646 RepID=M2LC12_BAUPA|nr:uncharacterized protein BAUCODRAFT_329514 [Baudoinia panamericana UAMH 10762]EMC91462.1 hypothetical protein BAUCODRAFT_329514 [Baudoinia panamericana UAMH 10762]